MKAAFLALIGAVVSVLAFPPFGPGWLVVVGVALLLAAVRLVPGTKAGFAVGALYGLVFFGGVMWWLAELDSLALILVPVQALFVAVYGWWLTRHSDAQPWAWLLLAVGGWASMEVIRYRFPFGGQEWGAAGYAVSDSLLLRLPASVVGTSGVSVMIVLIAAMIALALTRRWDWRVAWALALPIVVYAAAVPALVSHVDHGPYTVAIVQGSTPCPFERCPPDERLRTFQLHLDLTGTIQRGSVRLVVWPESSTGSTNADPVLNEEVRDMISEQARRIGAPILVGGDRVVSTEQFINANVLFDAAGDVAGEYRKQHPVPFGEYVPARPLFGWIRTLEQVPRDMVRGDGPVIFDLRDGTRLGSVISWEGGFSRYALQHRRAGANLLAVTTNTASYGPDAPTSDQFIGMTRMRAVELGVPLVHAAVTGKSTIIDHQGGFGETTETGESVVLSADTGPSRPTIYTDTGDILLFAAALAGLGLGWRHSTLVGSRGRKNQED